MNRIKPLAIIIIFCVSATSQTRPESPKITKITGAEIVCAGMPEYYSIKNKIAGTKIGWKADGGIIIGSNYGNTITVVFNNYRFKGYYGLKLWREKIGDATVSSDTVYKKINSERIDFKISGDSIPDADTYQNYKCSYADADSYQWEVFPKDAGCIAKGNNSESVTVFWYSNHVQRTAAVILRVEKCGLGYKQTFPIVLTESKPNRISNLQCYPRPDAQFSFDSLICDGEAAQFSAYDKRPGNSYVWDFGDNTFSSHPNPVKVFAYANMHAVSLTVTDQFGCTMVGHIR